MMKTLQRQGDSHVLVIDDALLEALGIREDTPLDVTVSGGSLVITPAAAGLGPERVRELMGEVRKKYGTALRNLAK